MPLPDSASTPLPLLDGVAIAMLAPFFLPYTGFDLGAARAAAWQAMQSCRIDSPVDLLPVLQILAFGYASVVSLAQSMDDDLPPPLRLRFRANAGTLDRAHARALRQHRQAQHQRTRTPDVAAPEPAMPEAIRPEPARPEPALTAPESPPPASDAAPSPRQPAARPAAAHRPSATHHQAPAQRSAAPRGMTEAQRRLWAEAMSDVAREFAAEAATPGNSVRARVLNSVARDLLTGALHPATGATPGSAGQGHWQARHSS